MTILAPWRYATRGIALHPAPSPDASPHSPPSPPESPAEGGPAGHGASAYATTVAE